VNNGDEKPGGNSLNVMLPIVILVGNEALIYHTCRCNYMNEIDNRIIQPTNWNLDFLDIWKFSKIFYIYQYINDGQF
jgi:hypothetical protein